MTVHHARYSQDDLAYLASEYLTLEQLCSARNETPEQVRQWIIDLALPRATYVLEDGTELFPPDYFALLDEAGDVDDIRSHFDNRHRIAAVALGAGTDSREDWEGYLSGEFGVCLRDVTPEAMVEKGALIAQIDRLTAAADPDDERWTSALRAAVDRLDEIERPFTDYDRQRWGAVSRDRHITEVRAVYLDHR